MGLERIIPKAVAAFRGLSKRRASRLFALGIKKADNILVGETEPILRQEGKNLVFKNPTSADLRVMIEAAPKIGVEAYGLPRRPTSLVFRTVVDNPKGDVYAVRATATHGDIMDLLDRAGVELKNPERGFMEVSPRGEILKFLGYDE